MSTQRVAVAGQSTLVRHGAVHAPVPPSAPAPGTQRNDWHSLPLVHAVPAGAVMDEVPQMKSIVFVA